MFSHTTQNINSLAHRRVAGNSRNALLTAWPSVVAYREELRRAVANIEERRQRRMRSY